MYVLVRNLGFGGNTNRSGPHLLLMGHKQHNDRRHWGVPGGLMDRSDTGPMYTAVREFLEEMGVSQRPSRRDVDKARSAMGLRGMQMVVPTNNSGFSAFAVVFDTALAFENEMGITNMLRTKRLTFPPDINAKYNVDLSAETKGFTYVPVNAPPRPVLPSFQVRPPQGPSYRAVRAGPGLQVTQLKLRRGISERALRGAARML
jgi:8-oxo-dGTP pyrophosphatase MutT (NUDIX family)